MSQPRQDSYRVLVDRSFIHVAVADGVGSQDHSHIGADVAALAAVEASRLGNEASQVVEAATQRILATAASMGIEPVRLSTTLCWARIEVGEPHTAWAVEAAEWGDSEVLVYDTRKLRDGHPRWQRLRKQDDNPANLVRALPLHSEMQAYSNDVSWSAGEVFGLFSDGVASDVRYDTVLGHALAKEWNTVPSPWSFIGQLAFRYRPANDDRTAVVLWRRDFGSDNDSTMADAEERKSERRAARDHLHEIADPLDSPRSAQVVNSSPPL
ncbi:MAG: protein phosphatase 2C domain-containing protein [Planctomycetales bacterium]|nr:protein phosphatase 2C domain-containing protein [Planctomycetales bacterium]